MLMIKLRANPVSAMLIVVAALLTFVSAVRWSTRR